MLHLDFMKRVLFWIHNSVQHDAAQKKTHYMCVIWFLKQMIYLDCGHRHGLNSLDFLFLYQCGVIILQYFAKFRLSKWIRFALLSDTNVTLTWRCVHQCKL
jgi:hypothetical protein